MVKVTWSQQTYIRGSPKNNKDIHISQTLKFVQEIHLPTPTVENTMSLNDLSCDALNPAVSCDKFTDRVISGRGECAIDPCAAIYCSNSKDYRFREYNYNVCVFDFYTDWYACTVMAGFHVHDPDTKTAIETTIVIEELRRDVTSLSNTEYVATIRGGLHPTCQ